MRKSSKILDDIFSSVVIVNRALFLCLISLCLQVTTHIIRYHDCSDEPFVLQHYINHGMAD